ncbi:hypothetical protein C8J57DRAFT_1705452 [Mycena rebaudengoi]|nr:hypothetical protein C8J57DRAFT_1705452 [Mycena rebaudengoi]
MPPLPVVTYVLGGWNLGTHADLILQGILFAQFTNYWSRFYKSDSLPLKLFVLGLLLATTLKSAQAIALVWIQNVEYFMDLKKAANMSFGNWVTQINGIMGAVIGFSVQAFFCRRLWLISNNIYMVAFVVLLFIFGLVAAITAFEFSAQMLVVLQTSGSFVSTDKRIWGPIHYAAVVTGDLILSGSTIYFLLVGTIPTSADAEDGDTEQTYEDHIPVTLCALANFICQTHYAHDTSTDATLLWVILTTMMLPKLYVISAMWTLNSRKEMRSRFSADVSFSSVNFRSRQMATTIQFGRHSVSGLDLRKEMSSRFVADVSSCPENFSTREMEPTIKFERHSFDGGPAARIEGQEETHEMVDIPVHLFQPRIIPYPDDTNPTQADA